MINNSIIISESGSECSSASAGRILRALSKKTPPPAPRLVCVETNPGPQAHQKKKKPQPSSSKGSHPTPRNSPSERGFVTQYTALPASASVIVRRPTPSISSVRPGVVRVKHREMLPAFVQPVASQFTAAAWNMNPGRSYLPWIQGLASRFEEYRYHSLSAVIISKRSTAEKGNIYSAFDGDVVDSDPSSDSAFMELQGSQVMPMWVNSNGMCTVHCPKNILTRLPKFLVQSVESSNTLNDVANLLVATDASTTGSVCSIWIEYDLELSVPVSFSSVPAVHYNNGLLTAETVMKGGSNSFHCHTASLLPVIVAGPPPRFGYWGTSTVTAYNNLGVQLSSGFPGVSNSLTLSVARPGCYLLRLVLQVGGTVNYLNNTPDNTTSYWPAVRVYDANARNNQGSRRCGFGPSDVVSSSFAGSLLSPDNMCFGSALSGGIYSGVSVAGKPGIGNRVYDQTNATVSTCGVWTASRTGANVYSNNNATSCLLEQRFSVISNTNTFLEFQPFTTYDQTNTDVACSITILECPPWIGAGDARA